MRWLSKDEEAVLRSIAERHGFIAPSGPTAKQGSASYLLDSIIKGETATVLLGDEERRWFIGWLERQQVDDALWADIPRDVATQLRAAAQREQEND